MSEFKKLLKKALAGQLDEVSPPGFKGTVKAMKKHRDIDNPYALGWWMKNKGYKSHKKASGADKNEAVGDSSGADPTYQMLQGAAERYIDAGLSPEQVEAHAKQMRPKFDASADYEMAVAAIMRRLLGQVGAPVRESMDDMFRSMKAAAEYNIKFGLSPDDVERQADEAEHNFPASAAGIRGVARMMRDILQQTETLGGGKATDVSLTDARGSSGMAGHLEGETSGYVATSDLQAYAGDQARGDATDSELKLPGHDDEFSEETGDNWSTTDGPGATGMTTWVSTDALPETPLSYDMDIGKLPESFDFTLGENAPTLAAAKGIKKVSQQGQEGKDTKFIPEPEGRRRPNYKELGAKDVKDADNLSGEAISDEMKNSAYESIRVDHVTKGRGTVLEISESSIVIDWDRSSLRILGPERLPLSETKYLTRIKERYSDDPEDAEVDKQPEPKGKKKMAKKKQKVDEAWMSAIKSTMRDTSDGYKLPVIDLSPEDIGLVNEYDLPDPGDSVLTGQDQQKAPSIEPLSTERGADAAHDDIYPDGDFATDLVPDDAPGVPTYDKMGDEAGNTRSVDGSSERPSADVGSNSAGKSDDIKPDNYDEKKYGDTDKDESNKVTDDSDDKDEDEDKEMKEGLTWEDIGLNINEMAYEDEACEGCGDYMDETHDTGGGEVGLTPGLLKKLLSAIRDQSPDDSKMEFICTGLAEASREKGATLDEADIGMIMGEIKEASQGGADLDADQELDGAHAEDDYQDPNSIGGADSEMAEYEGNEAGDARQFSQGKRNPDGEGARDDRNSSKASKYTGKSWAHEEEGDDEYEDKAAGDGKEAGPEGGKEHEGKTQLMDKKGKDQDGDGDVDSDDWRISRDKAIKSSKQRRGERRAKQSRKYGESKGEPKQDNYGGDNKRKSEKGKSGTPIGSKKGAGPGGGNTSNAGQDPLIPEVPDGNQLGAHGTPISKEGGGRTVDPISESMVAVGMAAIGGTVRNFNEQPDDDGLTADEKELRMIKRRAGIEDWWK